QLLHENIKAREALRHMGPAAVPALADAVSRRRSRLWTQLAAWRRNLPSFLARRLPNPAMDQLLQERAIEVLYEFGPAAARAGPDRSGSQRRPPRTLNRAASGRRLRPLGGHSRPVDGRARFGNDRADPGEDSERP